MGYLAPSLAPSTVHFGLGMPITVTVLMLMPMPMPMPVPTKTWYQDRAEEGTPSGAILFLWRALGIQFRFHSRTTPGPFAACFVTVEPFYALMALPSVFGTCRMSKKPQNGHTKRAKKMSFGSSVGSWAEAENPFFHPFAPYCFLGHTGCQNGPSSPQNGLKTHRQALQAVQRHFWKSSF